MMDGFSAYRCSTADASKDFANGDLCAAAFDNLARLGLQFEELFQPSASECEAYELYIQLPRLSSHWNNRLWPAWENEDILRPALQSLELSFRVISYILCDSRPYLDTEEWMRRLENLINLELEMVALISEGDIHAPMAKLTVSKGVVDFAAAQEVWQRPGGQAVVAKSSQESLLPRLACWSKSFDVVSRIRLAIECQMLRAPFTLGLGEPKFRQKPILEYDQICKPSDVYEYRRSRVPEDHTLSTTHQILECWLFVAHRLLSRVKHLVVGNESPARAARLCWMVERVWKIMCSTMDLLLLMDADDFMKLKHDLAIDQLSSSSLKGSFCLRSNMLREVTNICKDELRALVPKLAGVEADPTGGPRLQEALMVLLHTRGPSLHQYAIIHLLQSFQAIETAVRKFFFSYQQLVICVMGSSAILKASYRADFSAVDAVSQLYLEPPYFPSLDGAKTFLGDCYASQLHKERKYGFVLELGNFFR